MIHKVVLIATLLFLLVSVLSGVPAAEWYVDGSVEESGEGRTWETAFKAIQEGIGAASDGDVVIVARGHYLENIHFKGKIIILRSTAPLDSDVVANTIIDGNRAGSVVTFYGTEDESCVLSGFTVRNGKAEEGGGIYGGMPHRHTHATIENNTISENSTVGGGGFAYCDGTIQNNTVTGNSAEWSGGGLACCDGMVQNNTISGNSAARGGGLAECYATVQNNMIVANSAGDDGSGLYECDGTIPDNALFGNSADKSGGALYGCDGVIQKNIIAHNSADSLGGGLCECHGTILNNTIFENSAGYGGGLHGCRGTILNCIIWENKGTFPGGQIYDSSTPSFSCIADWTGGEGNIAEDPKFVDPDGPDDNPETYGDNDYHLSPESPCLDAGAPDAEYNDSDGTRNDMGAYGGTCVLPPSGTRYHSTLYIDENCQVWDFFDVAIHISYDARTLTALGVEETVPDGWTFVSVSGDHPPDVKPSPGASGTLNFGWTTPPGLGGVDFIYTLTVPDTANRDVHFTGAVVYRRNAREHRATIPETVALDYAVVRAERRYLDGDRPPEFYTPDSDYEMVIRIDYLGDLTAIGVKDTPPAGWTFVSVGGPNPPAFRPPAGSGGTFDFAWLTPPSSPVCFTYKVHVPADEEREKDFSGGKVLYRGTGGEIQHGIVPDPFIQHEIIPHRFNIQPVWLFNVLTVLVYNQNDIATHPPGTTITISPIVGTIDNWMYSYPLPGGTYSIDVAAPNFSPEHRSIDLTSDTTENFYLAPDPGSVSGKVVSTNTSKNIRGASVELKVTSGQLYLGETYEALTGADGSFSLTDLPAAVEYEVTVSKTFYDAYQEALTLKAGEAKDLGAISLGFTDDDDDGLPDAFEQGIVDFDPDDEIDDIADVHGDDDFDSDDQTNGDEYLARTDPTSSSSCFKVLSIVRTASDAFTVTWSSVSGMLYKLYYGDAIGGWSLGPSDIPASETGQNSWTDEASGPIPPPEEANTRFYRVEAY